MEERPYVKLPLSVQDALLLEKAWVRMIDPAAKLFIKYEFIHRAPHQVVRRKVRKYGIKIYSPIEHMIYRRQTLQYFNRSIERGQTV